MSVPACLDAACLDAALLPQSYWDADRLDGADSVSG